MGICKNYRLAFTNTVIVKQEISFLGTPSRGASVKRESTPKVIKRVDSTLHY